MKDVHELPDIQSTIDERGLALQLAGINELRIPLYMELSPNEPRRVDATVSLAVNVPAKDRGVHMSRLVEVWSSYFCSPNQNSQVKPRVIKHNLKEILQHTCSSLGSVSATCKVEFIHYVERFAPTTGRAAPLAIDCSYQASIDITAGGETYKQITSVHIPISTLCPCSKAISNYGAHNQRAILSASASLNDTAMVTALELNEFITMLEGCASCPVYPVLKRPDEKFVTEKQYDNAKFVEDVARDAVAVLRSLPQVGGFAVKVVALESIHAHNAWAAHRENFTELEFYRTGILQN